MAGIDENNLVPVDGGGVNENNLVPADSSVDSQLRSDREASFPINPEIGGPHQTFVKQHLADLAQHVYNFFDKHNQQGIGEGLSSLIYGLAPDSKTGQAMMVLASALPAMGTAAGAASEAVAEASPLLSKTLGYVSTLGESGMAGRAARIGTATAAGAATGAASGEGAVSGAEQGLTQEAGAEIPSAVHDAGQWAYGAAVDKQGLVSAAQDAAAATEKGNAKTAETLARRAMKEDAAQRKAEQAAVDAASERNLAAKAKSFEQAKAAAISKGQAAAQTLGEAEQFPAAAADKLAQQTAPAVRERIIQQATGRSPEQTDAAIHSAPEVSEGVEVPGPEFVARRQKYLDAAYGPTQRAQDELGRQYDQVLGPYLNNPVQDVSPIGDAVASEEKYATENNVVHSAPVKKLLADVKGISQPADPLGQYYSPEDLASLTPRQRANLEAQTRETLAKPKVRTTSYVGSENAGAGVAAAAPPQAASNVTVAQLRGLRGQAAALVSKSTSGTDKATANAIRESIEQSLESAGVPGVKDLNAKYATFKSLFGNDYYRGIAKAKDPIDSAELLFNEPQRAARLVGNSTPEQQQTLREIYGDAVNRDGAKFVNVKTQKPVLERLFPNTPLSDPKNWIHLPDKLVKAQDLLNDDPAFQQQVSDMMGAERRKAATAIVQDLMGEVKKLGPAGQPIMQQVSQAKSPEEAATILTQALTGMKPEDAARAMAAQNVSPDQAAAIAGAGMQRVQRSRMANFQPADPNQAAISLIQQGQRKSAGGANYIMERSQKLFPLYGSFAALSLLMGKEPSMWMSGMAGMGLLAGGTGLLKKVFTASLQNPANAAALWRAVQAPTEQASKNIIAQGITRLVASAGINAFMNDAPNPTDQPAPAIQPPIAPAPPNPSDAPLPTMRTAYASAERDHDNAKLDEIRNDVMKRLKKGEWGTLPPDQQRKLAPWVREMFGPRSTAALAG